MQTWPLTIEVPFAPESTASGIGDTGFHPSCWIQRKFHCPSDGDRVIPRFGAADYTASVWVNQKLAVTHDDGCTPFWANLTDLPDPSGRQTVTV